MKQITRKGATFAALTMIVGILTLPQSAAAQDVEIVRQESDGLVRTYMFFPLSQDQQFAKAKAVITRGIYNALYDNERQIRNLVAESDLATVVGTQDSLKYDKKGEMPLTETEDSERVETNDYQLAETRGKVVSGELTRLISGRAMEMLKIQHAGSTVPNDEQVPNKSRIHDLLNQRAFYIVFDDYKGSDGLSESEISDRLAQLKDDLEGRLSEIAEQAERAEAKADSALANDARQDEEIGKLWSSVNADSDNGANTRGHIGLGALSYGGVIMPAIQLGWDFGQADFSVWGSYRPDAGSAELEEGTRSYDRWSVGGAFTYYPVQLNGLRIGPAIGLEYSHDFFQNTEDICEIKQLAVMGGVQLDVPVYRSVSIFAGAFYTKPVALTTNREHLEVDDGWYIQGQAGIQVSF